MQWIISIIILLKLLFDAICRHPIFFWCCIFRVASPDESTRVSEIYQSRVYMRTAGTLWPKILRQLGWKWEKRGLSLCMFKISASNHNRFPVAVVWNCNFLHSFCQPVSEVDLLWVAMYQETGCLAIQLLTVVTLIAHVKSLLTDHWWPKRLLLPRHRSIDSGGNAGTYR